MLNIASYAKESIVDGDGLRFTLFVQGCPHHCEGCHNPSTWEFGKGKKVGYKTIFNMMVENPLLEGITLSGGEPFMQAEDLYLLAKLVHSNDMNVWCYTGFTYEYLLEHGTTAQKQLLDEIDVLVDGRFELEKRDISLMFRGSSNQRVINLEETRKHGELLLLYNDIGEIACQKKPPF